MPFYTVTYIGTAKCMRQQDILAIIDNPDDQEYDNDDLVPSHDALSESVTAKYSMSYPELKMETLHHAMLRNNITMNAILMEGDEDVPVVTKMKCMKSL